MSTSNPPSVLLYGDYLPERLATSYQRAFANLGCRVIAFDTQQMPEYLAPFLKQRVTHRLTIQNLALRRIGSAKWNQKFLQTCRDEKPDFVFIINGQFLMPETLRAVRQSGSKVFIFHADNPFPPFPNVRPEMSGAMCECDCYFIWSRSLLPRLLEAGAPRAEFLGFAWDAEVFPTQPLATQPQHDLIFIGGWDKEREAFLEPLARRFDLKIWGPPYWQHRTRPDSALRACWQGREVNGAEVSRLASESKIVLNVLRAQNLPDGVIMRTYEVPGCGGFLLSTRTTGAQEIFPEHPPNGESGGAYFEGESECIRQIEHFLARDGERRDIARRAHEIVCQGHEFEDRARQILSVAHSL